MLEAPRVTQCRVLTVIGSLARSVALATPGGWIRPDVDIAAPTVELLDRMPAALAETALFERIVGNGEVEAGAH